jgi:hypothetical protein
MIYNDLNTASTAFYISKYGLETIEKQLQHIHDNPKLFPDHEAVAIIEGHHTRAVKITSELYDNLRMLQG